MLLFLEEISLGAEVIIRPDLRVGGWLTKFEVFKSLFRYLKLETFTLRSRFQTLVCNLTEARSLVFIEGQHECQEAYYLIGERLFQTEKSVLYHFNSVVLLVHLIKALHFFQSTHLVQDQSRGEDV